jgi:hypothetical protein
MTRKAHRGYCRRRLAGHVLQQPPFSPVLFGLRGNACRIETIDLLAQKVYGIRSYANAFPESLDGARRDHFDMIKALRGSRRDDLVALTRRHLKPSPEAYIRAYERRFGKADFRFSARALNRKRPGELPPSTQSNALTPRVCRILRGRLSGAIRRCSPA